VLIPIYHITGFCVRVTLVQSVLWSWGTKSASKLDLHTNHHKGARVCKVAEFFEYYVFEPVTNPDNFQDFRNNYHVPMDRYNDVDNHLFAFTLLLLILAFCIFFICCSKKHNQDNNINPAQPVLLNTTPKPDSTFLSENPPGYHTCTKGSKISNSNSNSCISYSPPHTPLPDYSIAIRDDVVV